MTRFYDNASGIVFDCDGTLLNTMDAWNQAEAALINRARVPFTREQLDEVRSVPIERGAELFVEHGAGKTPDDVIRFLDDELMGFYQTKAQALPGAKALLRRVWDAGIPTTVVTSSPLRYVEAGLACAGIPNEFGKIICTDEVGMSKNEGCIYQHALDVMDAKCETAWGIDDALYAIRTMNEFGLRTIGTYECDETATFEQLAQEATIAVRSLEELL